MQNKQKTLASKVKRFLLSLFLTLLILTLVTISTHTTVQAEHLSIDIPFGYSLQRQNDEYLILDRHSAVGGVLFYRNLSEEEITQLSGFSSSDTLHDTNLPEREVLSHFLSQTSREKYDGNATKMLSSSLYGDFELSLEYPNDPQNEEHYFFLEPEKHILTDIWFFSDDISVKNRNRILSSVQCQR